LRTNVFMSMKEKFLELKLRFLQSIADFIYFRLQEAKSDREFDYWMWQGLRLNSWCVDRNIWLN